MTGPDPATANGARRPSDAGRAIEGRADDDPSTVRRLLPLAALVMTAFGCSGVTVTARPTADAHDRALLVRALGAVRALGRTDGPCRDCYPTDPSEITEDMYMRTGDQYGEVASPAQVRFRDVVYLDTTGASRLAPHHVTLYVRDRGGRLWRLDANGGGGRITPA